MNKKLICRRTALVIMDVIWFAVASCLSLLLRYEFEMESLLATGFLDNVVKLLPLTVVTAIVSYTLFGLYSSLWKYASDMELLKIAAATIVAAMVQMIIQFLFMLEVPRSFVVLQFLLLLCGTAGSRFFYRFARRIRNMRAKYRGNAVRTMIIGAGHNGEILMRELENNSTVRNVVVCMLDDDRNKVGSRVHGVPVVGNTSEIASVVNRYNVAEIIYAIPAADPEKRKSILDACSQTRCRVRIFPGIAQIMDGQSNLHKVRDVQIEDLLARPSIHINSQKELQYYTGKSVMVTGGGGSIGSEICRQVMRCKPRQLIIVDIYENNAYDIQQELIQEYGRDLNLVVEIASVRDRQRLDMLFDLYRPEIVFHAAAHKHVPLMEHSACEAVKNNILGTYNVADMAEKYGVRKFVQISTDKAVNPTNIMGASKRVCEMIVQSRTESATCFAAVRFGNVLGSNGSVIPMFKRQIAQGGPVTITDKRIIRYFMTIAEASQLVMEAGAMAKKGELFVLDMGQPVKIYDLATNLIKLSGMEPNVDIMIEEIGLRPGEKLYEELLIKTEQLSRTPNDLIFIEKDTPLSREEVAQKVELLMDAAQRSYEEGQQVVRDAFKQVVPTFYDPEELNKAASQAEEMKLAGSASC